MPDWQSALAELPNRHIPGCLCPPPTVASPVLLRLQALAHSNPSHHFASMCVPVGILPSLPSQGICTLPCLCCQHKCTPTPYPPPYHHCHRSTGSNETTSPCRQHCCLPKTKHGEQQATPSVPHPIPCRDPLPSSSHDAAQLLQMPAWRPAPWHWLAPCHSPCVHTAIAVGTCKRVQGPSLLLPPYEVLWLALAHWSVVTSVTGALEFNIRPNQAS